MASSADGQDPRSLENKSLVALCKQFAVKVGLKPLTANNLLYYYTPLTGVISYTALSVNVMNPSLAFKVLQKRDLTNILLVHTLFGTGVYISSRSHLRSASPKARLGYSVFGAVMFTFGSVLSWAIMRSVLPESTFICTVVGVGTSYALVQAGKEYMNFLDSRPAVRSS